MGFIKKSTALSLNALGAKSLLLVVIIMFLVSFVISMCSKILTVSKYISVKTTSTWIEFYHKIH